MLVGEVVIVEGRNRQAAEGHIPVSTTMQNAILSNAPRVSFKRVGKMSCLIEFWQAIPYIEDLLKADHIGVKRLKNAGNALRTGFAVHPPTLVDIVSYDSKMSERWGHCCCWMIQPKNSGARSTHGRLSHSS